ncbi:hypothetical protein CDL26_04315 [Mediterraneibacter gnavus]|uniref:Carboxymuconolactone decarboxylase-like domain-containing protein n=1 Tax=Mediterraneibacter gnavus TaxID=33038 RepID=A0A2N5PPI5_MEDGN|nr:hypothetical protein CDL26_04315 [Mediterraneibacter gnavus]PLT77055.1 hypothetical protein CDL23_02500 [Mediterraneibacter gnavus]
MRYHDLDQKNTIIERKFLKWKKLYRQQEEIAAVITHAAFYAGWPKAWAVFNLAKEVWDAEVTE